MGIECLVLGAGQEVGKSCVVVTVGGKRIMFDCGMHMGCVEDPYPDFSRISPTGDFDAALSCVVITHFHLDHVGALPFFTEVCGYRGPIYMTYPTKALSPLMLEDYRKVMVDRRGEQEKFSHDHILDCMKKVIAVDIKQTIQVDKDLQIRAYYAGHVLGAAMFYAKVGESSLVYTGDYNMTPDRHLGAAQIDHLQLNLLITESTYATTIRDSKYAREREFLKVVHRCIVDGGKVLIPTFAMGRAQELCILLEDYWERMNLKVPIYFSAGLTVQANMYYKMLVGWTSQKLKNSFAKHNAFDFKHVHPFSRSQIDAPGPCVLFATPGMLTGGFSLEVFKHWAPSEKNLITLPGYCLAGTVGHKLMSGKGTRIHLDGNTQINVRCQIHQLSFSPHTDAKGIMDLIQFLSPCHVILVHGEKPNMEKLRGRIQTELGIRCYSPANNETLLIPTNQTVKVDASKEFLKNVSTFNFSSTHNHPHATSDIRLKDIQTSNLLWSRDERVDEGILVMKKAKRARILHENELLQTLNVQEHKIKFHYCFPVVASSLQKAVTQQCLEPCESAESSSSIKMNQGQFDKKTYSSVGRCDSLHLLRLKIKDLVNLDSVLEGSDNLALGSLQINVCENDSCPHRSKENIGILGQSIFFCCRWSFCDEQLVRRVFSAMRNLEWGMIKSDKRAA